MGCAAAFSAVRMQRPASPRARALVAPAPSSIPVSAGAASGSRREHNRERTAAQDWRPQALPPIDQYKWELYNLKEDYSQNDDLAAKMPGKLKEMQALFLQEAKKYNVLPLQNTTFDRAISPRPALSRRLELAVP